MEKLSGQTIAAAAAAMAIIAFIDAQTSQISLWPLYMAPVIALSWSGGFLAGGIGAASAGALLLVSGSLGGHPYSHDYFFALATASHIATLFVIAWGASRIAAMESILKKLLRA